MYMGKSRFDYKKQMNARFSNRRKILRTSSMLLAAGLLSTAPISQAFVPIFNTNVAHAASLVDVNLLSDVNVDASLENVEGPYYNLKLALTGTGLANLDVIHSDKVVLFYAPDLAGKMNVDGMANVR